MVTALQADPTRTGLQRRQFMQALSGRYRRLRGAVLHLIVDEDAFGLKARTPGTVLGLNGLVTNTRWAFLTDADKLTAFQEWFAEQAKSEILIPAPGTDPSKPWTTKYSQSSYMKGVNRAYLDTHKEALAAGVPPEIFEGGAKQFIADAFGGHVATGKIQLLATRSFEQLKGVNAAMGQELSRVLSDGMAHGHGPAKVARDINKSISGITKKRAMTIARTEVIHAHAEGQLDSFQQLGVDELGVLAEWATAEDGKVCKLCAALNGAIMTVDEARGILPRHPNCRCAWYPAGIGEPTTGQAWAKDIIDDQMLKSMKLETGLAGGAKARLASRWLGADKKISTKSHLKPTKANLAKAKAKLDAAQKAAAEKAAAELAAKKAARAAAILKAQQEAAAAKAAAKLLHSQKTKAGTAKAKLKKQYGLTEDDFWVPPDKQISELTTTGITKLTKADLGENYAIPYQGKAISFDDWNNDIVGRPVHEAWAAYQQHLPLMKAKAQFYDDFKFPISKTKLANPDGTLTVDGIKHAFGDIPAKHIPLTADGFKAVAGIQSFETQAKGIKSLIAQASKSQADEAAAAVAAKEAHSKKIKVGMAKKTLQGDKYGNLDMTPGNGMAYTNSSGELVLTQDGIEKALATKGVTVDYETLNDLSNLDLLAQKAGIDALKSPKGWKAKQTKTLKAQQALSGEDYGFIDFTEPGVSYTSADLHTVLTAKGIKQAVLAKFPDIDATDLNLFANEVDSVLDLAKQKAAIDKYKPPKPKVKPKAKPAKVTLDDIDTPNTTATEVMDGMQKGGYGDLPAHAFTDSPDGSTLTLTPTGLTDILEHHNIPLGETGLSFQKANELLFLNDLVKQKPLLDDIIETFGTAQVTGTAKAIPDDMAGLTFVKKLPGSTQPSLMKDAAGKKWVVKDTSDNLKPDHITSEALADDLYKAAGFDVPKGKLIQTAEGPSKVTEFLDGQTLADWQRGKTAAQIKAMNDDISEGFVADALFANHDVAGLSNDNIFIVAGKPYRIDNGGALTFRAQGAPKADFGAVVKELETLRDASINPVTAKIFKNITDEQIYGQIRDLLQHRATILAKTKGQLKKTLEARLNYLEGLLPPETTVTRSAKAPAIYDLNEDAAKVIQEARLNGRSLSADMDLIEDNNILVWQEADINGDMVTKVHLKVSRKGNDVLETSLGKEFKKAKQAGPTNGAVTVDTDYYWQDLESALKTVAYHADDGKYNEATIATFNKTVKTIKELKPKAGTPEADMVKYYTKVGEDIESAYLNGTKPPVHKQFTYKIKKQEDDGNALQRRILVSKRNEVGWPVKDHNNGRASANHKGKNRYEGESYDIELDDDIQAIFVPMKKGLPTGDHGARQGLAFEGTFEITINGSVSPTTLKKATGILDTLGVNTKPPTPDYEELMYLHRTVYQRNDHTLAGYANVFNDPDLTDRQKVKKIKAWASKRYSVDFDEAAKTGQYNPSGRAKNSFGDGSRNWTRWDMSQDELEEGMKDYKLTHDVGKPMETVINGMLQTGGETTSTVMRVRKGIDVGATGGMSAGADVTTGGASYFFTRIKHLTNLRSTGRGNGRLVFKVRNLMRQDTISYDEDKYGRIWLLNQRYNTIDGYKEASLGSTNETLFKEGMSLIDEIDYIWCVSQRERKAIIKMFKDNKLATLPDGRKIDDIVGVAD